MRQIIVIAFLLLIAGPALRAQTGSYSGSIRGVDGEMSHGVAFLLDGSGRFDSTDAEGRFTFDGIPVGDWSILFLDRSGAMKVLNICVRPGVAAGVMKVMAQTECYWERTTSGRYETSSRDLDRSTTTSIVDAVKRMGVRVIGSGEPRVP